MNKKIDKRKKVVAIILLIVFGGSIILSGIITLFVMFVNKQTPITTNSDQTAIARGTQIESTPQATPNIVSEQGVVNQTMTPTPSSDAATMAPTSSPKAEQQADTSNAPENKPSENVQSPLVLPTVSYSVNGQNILVKANVNSPDGTVFSVVVMSTDMSITKKASGIVKSGSIDFTVEMPDKTQRQLIGSLQLSMKDNAQPAAAVGLYGENGEKIKADEKKGGRIVSGSNADGSKTFKFEHMFNIQYK